MILRYGPPLIGTLMLLFAISHVVKRASSSQEGRTDPPGPLPERTITDLLAAIGAVEPATETIQMGTAVGGIVNEVAVRVGDTVKEGSVLARLKAGELEAEVKVNEAALESTQATLSRLRSLPRPEEIPAVEARVAEARALALDQKEQFERNGLLASRGAIGNEELRRKELGFLAATSRQRAAEADLKLLQAGAWKSDIQLQEAKVEEARAQLLAARAELDRRTVRAPRVTLPSGTTAEELTVLQVHIRPGEMASANTHLMLLGGLRRLHVRVDVDENDIARFKPTLGGEARTRGEPVARFALSFVRVEPYLVPKSSLKGSATERVDSRVLQVIYALPEGASGLFVGQQLDVFLGSN